MLQHYCGVGRSFLNWTSLGNMRKFNVKIWKLWNTWKYKNLTRKNSKSRNYTYSQKISRKALHHFTVSSTTSEISNFAYSATACCIPTMPVENIYYFLFIREWKNLQYEGNGFFQKICRSCKKLTNYKHLALCKTKKQSQVAAGLY